MPFRLIHGLGERYSPLLFLSALGAGGLTVSFFMYLLFWVPHPQTPIPVFEDVLAAYAGQAVAGKLAIAVALLGIVVFALMHIRLLLWNIAEYAAFRRTAAYTSLRAGNGETQLLAVPLTLAMAVNVFFIIGAVFVPGLWSIVEYLIPAAMVVFLAIGAYALSLLLDFFARVFTLGGFDCAKNNSLAQMLPTFALAMVGVGLAAPAAFSGIRLVAGLSLIASSFFLTLAVILGAIKLVLGFRGMMDQGTTKESLPTLWIIVPILTVLTIALLRQDHALHAFFGGQAGAGDSLVFLSQMLAAQVFFGLLGWVVMRREGYFETYITGPERSPASYALACPGVALAVMAHFFMNKGLVAAGLIDKFGPAYWVLAAVAVVIQLATIWLVVKLNMKLLAAEPGSGRAERPAS